MRQALRGAVIFAACAAFGLMLFGGYMVASLFVERYGYWGWIAFTPFALSFQPIIWNARDMLWFLQDPEIRQKREAAIAAWEALCDQAEIICKLRQRRLSFRKLKFGAALYDAMQIVMLRHPELSVTREWVETMPTRDEAADGLRDMRERFEKGPQAIEDLVAQVQANDLIPRHKKIVIIRRLRALKPGLVRMSAMLRKAEPLYRQ